MKTTRRVTTLLLVLSVLAHLQCSKGTKDNPGAEPRVTLKQAYPPGKYACVVDLVQKQKIEGEGQPQTIESSMTMEMLMAASAPDADGSTELTIRYTRFASPFVDTNVPSNAPPGSPQDVAERVYLAMIGHDLVMKLASDGKVLQVSGVTELWDRMAAAVGADGQVMVASLKQTVNDESLKKMVAGGEQFTPPHPVGIGAVWHVSTSMEAPIVGGLDVEAECELTELTDTPAGKVARIAFTGTLGSEGGGPTPAGSDFVQLGKLEITQEGFLRMDVDTGLPVEMKMHLVGTIDMSVQPPQGKKLDMTSHIDQTVTMTITAAE